jgi:hypothetical protein
VRSKGKGKGYLWRNLQVFAVIVSWCMSEGHLEGTFIYIDYNAEIGLVNKSSTKCCITIQEMLAYLHMDMENQEAI